MRSESTNEQTEANAGDITGGGRRRKHKKRADDDVNRID